MKNGYFIDEKKEYVITNMYPKRPLMNYIWNEQVMIDIDQFGFGSFSIYDAKRNRRELMTDGCNRHIYIFDNDTKKYYAANRNYKDLSFDIHQTHVGQGYSLVVSEYEGIRVEYKIFAPIEGTCECWELKIKNTSEKKRSVSVYPNANVCLNSTPHFAYVGAAWDEEIGGLYSVDPVFEASGAHDMFMISSYPTNGWEVSYDKFVGTYSNSEKPIALENGGTLSCTGISGCYNGSFALRHDLELVDGEEKNINIIIGIAENKGEIIDFKNRILLNDGFKANLEKIKARADMYDDKVNIRTGDETIDRFVNIWLKRQMDFGKTWARGYAIGSRDMMQDVTGFVSLDTKVSRDKLLYGMQFVRPNGNIIRCFVPVYKTLSHDCSSWMITAVCQYIKESGDFDILSVDCPYYESNEHGTVLDHLLRASSFLLDGTGEHGLTLWGECDWNDSMNGAGVKLKGESLWLSEATVKCSLELIELLDKIGKADIADSIRKKHKKMIENILEYGWEKDHFIYGFNDLGDKVGSYENTDGQSFLNPQTWAVLAKVLPEDRLNVLMDYVEDNLSCDFGYVQVKPAYHIHNPNIGRITYFQKGIYENGSVYNHGCAFKIVADCLLHRGNEALKSIEKMLPTNPKNDSTISGMEPYAISNMYYGPEHKYTPGYSPLHWISGTCAWLFRAIVEYMLGIGADYDGLKINPSLPESWKKASVHRTYRGCVYDITLIQNTYNGKVSITVDGEKIESDILPLFNDNNTHKVIVNIG